MRHTGPMSMVLQLRLVYGRGPENRISAPTYGSSVSVCDLTDILTPDLYGSVKIGDGLSYLQQNF